MDGKHNLITDVYWTPGNVHDAKPYLARLKRQKERFGFEVEAVALDAGYLTSPIGHTLKEQGIFTVIAHRRFHPQKGLFHKWQFKYDAERDLYICPGKHELTYRTTNRQGYQESSLIREHAGIARFYLGVAFEEPCENHYPSRMGRCQGVGSSKPVKQARKRSSTSERKRRSNGVSWMRRNYTDFATHG